MRGETAWIWLQALSCDTCTVLSSLVSSFKLLISRARPRLFKYHGEFLHVAQMFRRNKRRCLLIRR